MQSLISAVDDMVEASDIQGPYELLQKAMSADDGVLTGSTFDAEILWRWARALYLKGKEVKGGERKAFYELANAEIAKAMALDPAIPSVQKYAGICLGAMGEFLPTKEKIANAYKVKECFEKGIAAAPNDATLHHCLGSWCYQVMQIGMVERGIAKALFGTPPSSTYEECEKFLLKSAELNKTSVLNNLLLGDCFYQQKKYAEAKNWYQAAIDAPTTANYEKEAQAEAVKKITKC